MKAFIALIVSAGLVGCAVESKSPDTMAPLPTTGLDRTADKTVVITEPPTANLSEYFVFIHQRVVVPPEVNHDILLSYSDTWCDFMERGMGKSNVVAWITEMASDQAEMDLWLASAEASAYYICQDQAYKWNP